MNEKEWMVKEEMNGFKIYRALPDDYKYPTTFPYDKNGDLLVDEIKIEELHKTFKVGDKAIFMAAFQYAIGELKEWRGNLYLDSGRTVATLELEDKILRTSQGVINKKLLKEGTLLLKDKFV